MIPEIPIALNVYLQPQVAIAMILKDESADPKYMPPLEIDVAVVLVSGGKQSDNRVIDAGMQIDYSMPSKNLIAKNTANELVAPCT